MLVLAVVSVEADCETLAVVVNWVVEVVVTQLKFYKAGLML